MNIPHPRDRAESAVLAALPGRAHDVARLRALAEAAWPVNTPKASISAATAGKVRGSLTNSGMPSCLSRATSRGEVPLPHTTTNWGRKASTASRLKPLYDPTEGRDCAALGQSAYSTRPTRLPPAPMA